MNGYTVIEYCDMFLYGAMVEKNVKVLFFSKDKKECEEFLHEYLKTKEYNKSYDYNYSIQKIGEFYTESY